MSASLFENKEHYFAFRKAWSTAVNSDRAKSKIVERTVTYGNSTETYSELRSGWINAEHHILYNYLRQRPLYTGFTPIHDRTGLLNGWYVNHGMYFGNWRLRMLINSAKNILTRKPDDNHRDTWWDKSIARFLEPFGGTITVEMLAECKIPEIYQVGYYAHGKEIVDRIVAGGRITMEELYPLTVRMIKDTNIPYC